MRYISGYYYAPSGLSNDSDSMRNRLCENLTVLMDHHRVGAVQLARVTGIPLSTIKNIRKSTNTNPTIETLIPLANFFCVSLEELISSKDINRLVKSKNNDVSSRSLPVISWGEIGASPSEFSHSEEYIYTEKTFSEYAFALKLERENIDPFSAPGILLVNPDLKPKHLDYVLLQKTNVTDAFVKQVISNARERNSI